MERVKDGRRRDGRGMRNQLGSDEKTGKERLSANKKTEQNRGKK